MTKVSDIHVRLANAADARFIREILLDTFERTWRPNITLAAAQAYLEEDRPAVFVHERGLHAWVAESLGEIIGVVDWQGDFVNALHVTARYARRGVGAALMDRAEAEITGAGFPAARLETDTFNIGSQMFYAARGYVEVDRYPDLEWSSDLTTMLMTKALA